MILESKREPAGDLFLKRLDLAVLELCDLPAVGANYVIVMAFAGRVLEEGTSLTELSLVSEAGFLEEFEGPIDRDEADSMVSAAHAAVEGLSADVRVRGKEGPRDQLALAGGLVPGSSQVLLEPAKFMWHR